MTTDTIYLSWLEDNLVEMGKYDATTGPRFEIIYREPKSKEIVAACGPTLRKAIRAGIEGRFVRKV